MVGVELREEAWEVVGAGETVDGSGDARRWCCWKTTETLTRMNET